ncbi:MAG: DNA mismatch repair endonuclease MutL [Candidatus Kapaibacterium sp.]
MIKRNDNIIKILPDFIANQIAAGEVVQRPESVVKELVENSLDSGATEIAVVVRNAGKSLIHIIDNGSGMSKENLELSTKRHATSKIESQKDLEAIKTLGFRGEALASITSVAHVEIITRSENDKLGYKLISEPNKAPLIEEVNSNKGTQILVKNLFYNVPARRKFLKNNMSEFKAISETMIKFALSFPAIRFTFYDDDNLIFDLNASDLETRVIATLGKAIKDLIIPLEYEEEGIKVHGFVGKPFLAKQNSSNQYLFLNERTIKNRYLNHAIMSCYEELLEEKRFPFYVLFLEIDHNNIDINVHPQKHEVKFENDRLVYNVVKNAVMSTLREVNLIPEFKIDTELNYSPFQIERNSDNESIIVNRNTGEIIERSEQRGGDFPRNYSDSSFRKFNNNEYSNEISTDLNSIFSSNEEHSFEFLLIDDRFIIVKEQEHLLVIYKRRALQRIYYEHLLNSFNNRQTKSQDLLFPDEIKLEKKQISALKLQTENLKDFGFILEFENETVTISSVPEIIQNGNIKSIVERISNNLIDSEHSDREELHEFIAKIIAISINLNSKENKNKNELKMLYLDLFNCQNPYHSPTGKLTSFTISYSELEKKFRL